MKIVIDTNIIISAIFFGGRPRELIESLVLHSYGINNKNDTLEAFASAEIISEYRETVDELCKKYTQKHIPFPLPQIINAIRLITPTSTVTVCRDPDDNKFIECALDAECSYIISGDKDLLSLQRYQRVRIISVAEFFFQHHP